MQDGFTGLGLGALIAATYGAAAAAGPTVYAYFSGASVTVATSPELVAAGTAAGTYALGNAPKLEGLAPRVGAVAAEGAAVGETAATRFVSGVDVISRGRVIVSGTVDLGPTLKSIESGAIRARDIFMNRQALLPIQSPGYYQEFVLPTPGISGVGPQRIVQGLGGELFYTPDHYLNFIPLN